MIDSSATRRIALLLVLLGPVPEAGAQDEPTLSDYYVDFSVPDLPALGSLGFGSNSVTRPGTLKELSTSLLTLSDGTNAITPAVGIAWSPARTFAADSVDHQRERWYRRLSLSFGTITANGQSRVGAGARFVFVDRADPLRSYQSGLGHVGSFDTRLRQIYRDASERNRQAVSFSRQVDPLMAELAARMCHLHRFTTDGNCNEAEIRAELMGPWEIRLPPDLPTTFGQVLRFERTLNAVAAKRAPSTFEGGEENGQRIVSEHLRDRIYYFAGLYIETALRLPALKLEEVQALKQQWEESHWNAFVLSVDGGYVMVSPDSSWRRLRSEKMALAIAAALPAGPHGQVVIELEGLMALDDTMSERSHVSLGGRVLLGSSSKRFSFETVVANVDYRGRQENGWRSRATAGVEFRLTEGLWFEVAAGGERRPTIDEDGRSMLAFGGLKYAFRREARNLRH